jgi:N-acetylglucosamine repressor
LRKIDTKNFHLATRNTAREVNRQIVLNLIREHQPISRADLARKMSVRRAALTTLVAELIESGSIYEMDTPLVRLGPGRRPTMLRLSTSDHLAFAVDVRSGITRLALSDFAGRTVAREEFATPSTADGLVDALATHIEGLLANHGSSHAGRGIGVVVPGMVDRRSGRIVYAPRLGWRDVDIRDALASRTGMPVHVESAPIACALAKLWLSSQESRVRSFAYVSVSDGVGVGLVVKGEVLRGQNHTAGEFGHVTIEPSGPECVCGKRGCWEAFAGNSATVQRYAERVLKVRVGGTVRNVSWNQLPAPAVEEVIRRARKGEAAAVATLAETGRYIGRGLAAVVSAFNPGRIYLGGEVTAAWEILEGPLRQALAAETITDAARATPVVPDKSPGEYRLLGAVALVAAPTYALPKVG